MVISQLDGGLGNQMDQYAVGRALAYKLKTEFKLTLQRPWIPKKSTVTTNYRLNDFNIQEVFATPEEVKLVKEKGVIPNSAKDLENIQGDVFIQGHWVHNPALYRNIGDIIRKEFTLKKSFNPNAEVWRQKILSAECSVSMHFRHGDYAYALEGKGLAWAPILPLDYYYTCVGILKQCHSNITVFVFSDNLPWVKENLHLDVPTEFVEGCETDNEEFILMSLCKHNIAASSTFSRRAAWLNSNPEKRVFYNVKSTAKGVQEFIDSLTPDKKECLLKSWLICVPYDFDNQPKIKQRPIFSLLLVVNDDAATIQSTLDNLLSQNYRYYEVVIIDNASTDGSDKICCQAIEGKANVTLKRFEARVNNAVAWNEAFKAAQGYYVSFLESGDRFLPDAFEWLYGRNRSWEYDIIHLFAWLSEDENGKVSFADKKYSEQRDARFKVSKCSFTSVNINDAARLLINQQINSFLATKFYRVDFLKDNRITFDEKLSNKEAELSFQAEAFSKSNYYIYLPAAFYVAPKN